MLVDFKVAGLSHEAARGLRVAYTKEWLCEILRQVNSFSKARDTGWRETYQRLVQPPSRVYQLLDQHLMIDDLSLVYSGRMGKANALREAASPLGRWHVVEFLQHRGFSPARHMGKAFKQLCS